MSKKESKAGRPTDIPGDRIRTTVTLSTNNMVAIKIALLTTHQDRHKTISGLINEAVQQYLDTEKTAPKRGGTKE